MDGELDDVAFLANSPNRLSVLETLVRGPAEKTGLGERVDASRATIARVLSDMEDRRWVERSDDTYRVTPLGAWVAEEFGDLLTTMSAERRLRSVLPWFPTAHVAFDVRRLRDAEVVEPSPSKMWRHVQRIVECFRSARRARVVSSRAAPPIVEATTVAVKQREQRFEGVLTPNLIDTLRSDPTMEPLFTELLERPTTDVYVAAEEPPLIFFITDDTVGFPLVDDERIARALLLSDDGVVYDWAEAAFERHRAEADPIDRGALVA